MCAYARHVRCDKVLEHTNPTHYSFLAGAKQTTGRDGLWVDSAPASGAQHALTVLPPPRTTKDAIECTESAVATACGLLIAVTASSRTRRASGRRRRPTTEKPGQARSTDVPHLKVTPDSDLTATTSCQLRSEQGCSRIGHWVGERARRGEQGCRGRRAAISRAATAVLVIDSASFRPPSSPPRKHRKGSARTQNRRPLLRESRTCRMSIPSSP